MNHYQVLGFGAICGMDYVPSLRLMLLALNAKATREHISGEAIWSALVLADDGSTASPFEGWETGRVVTVAPAMRGFILIEEGEPVA